MAMRIALAIESVCVFAAPVRGMLETSLIVPLGAGAVLGGAVAGAQPTNAARTAARTANVLRLPEAVMGLAYSYFSRYQVSRACAQTGGALRNCTASRYQASRVGGESAGATMTGAVSSYQRSFIAEAASGAGKAAEAADETAAGAGDVIGSVRLDLTVRVTALTASATTIIAPTNFGRLTRSRRGCAR